mmetsp:Transcript_115582/g.361531  ORF Transcript_115582/g.361531 Transcript_115582/m.361531 type:complete len:658 (+) Transcript_115582:3-1976(+)
MLVDTAADGLHSHHLKGNEEVKKDFKLMQRMACKGGAPTPMSVRAELLKDKGSRPAPVAQATTDVVTPSELRQMRREAKEKTQGPRGPGAQEAPEEAPRERPREPAAPQRIRVPQHRLVHSGSLDLADFMEAGHQASPGAPTVPELLKLLVELPSVRRVGDINLEVTSNNVVVEVPQKYYLDLPLPYEVRESHGAAKFDKQKQVLSLELPVVPKAQVPNPGSARGVGEAAGAVDDGGLSEAGGSEEELEALEEEGRPREEAPTSCSGAGPAPPAPAPAPPPHERLDVAPERNSLRIAEPPPEVEGQVQQPPPSEASAFLAADSFAGPKPGYYFGTAAQGLGYYLDRRQPRPGGPSRDVLLPRPPSPKLPVGPGCSEALVTEVAAAAVPVAEPRAPLSPGVRRYLDTLAALAMRVTSTDSRASEAQAEPHVEWRQNTQNVMLFISTRAHDEVADVRLHLRGQRLTVTFCTRAMAEADCSTPWQRHLVCKTLCGLVDPRQWHAELSAGTPPTLIVSVRKADRAGLWAEIFDATAPAAMEPGERVSAFREAMVQGAAAEATATQGVAAQPERESSPCAEAGAGGPGEGTPLPGNEDARHAEDSAELDAAAPLEQVPAREAALGVAEGLPAKGVATDAMVQSAMVMGHCVLLRNRLMYELL